jgi:hypothetical protein
MEESRKWNLELEAQTLKRLPREADGSNGKRNGKPE